MIFLEAIIYCCLLALEISSTNTAFSGGSPVKTLEDIFERSISQKPSCNKYPYLLHTNDTPPPLEKKPQVEFHFSLLPKNQDLNQTPQDNKRNFQEAFENAESRPRKLSNIDREHYFSPQISSDHGDFASERDSFSTYTMKSHSSYVENDYASALKDSEHSYYNRFLRDKYISEYNHGLIHQSEPSSASNRIISNGARENQLREHQSLGESRLPLNIDPNISFTPETKADLAGDSFNALANNFRLTQQEEARELNGEVQSSKKKIESTHLIQFKHSHKISQRTRTRETNKNLIDKEELPLSVKPKSQTFYSEKSDKFDEIVLAPGSQSSLKVPERQNNTPRKNRKKGLLKDKGKSIKEVFGKKKSLKDVVKEYKFKLQDLSMQSSKKSPLSFFLETIDYYADNESSEYVPKKKKVSNPDYWKLCYQNPLIESFLGQINFPISQSQFNELDKAYKERNGEECRGLNHIFFKSIYDQINKNCDKNFYIVHQQEKDFFTFYAYDFKVVSETLNKIRKNRNYYSDQLANYLGEAINFFPWKVVSNLENRQEIFEQREFYLKSKNFNTSGLNYGAILNQRFDLRKLFLLYSTLMNKVFCSGKNDLLENFFRRQKDAINFFDEALSLLEVDPNEPDSYFIKREILPLNEDAKKIFFEESVLKFPNNTFQIKIIHRNKDLNGAIVLFHFFC
ncbi:hypothetical protein PPACK8108_LOCUS1285 [Phakopsora pachyrhizi]|uniref:Uncharacterized protein n=1 Tax=Phakopsora pachyrhizi TaxID=170000 RepID=A0AAV0AHU6_PHAPC|nr:hypothetical protein PPACK8108_LOCUS1285 [Phakopsora pachyrhizi]